MVNVGDKVKLDYISDRHPNNGKVGKVIEESKYKYYPNGDSTEVVLKQGCTIKYADGSTTQVQDTERKGSGVVSPLIVVESKN